MQALRWHGNRDVRLEDVDLELALGPGMIEVAVSYCGICGSDIAEYAHGPFAIRTGFVPFLHYFGRSANFLTISNSVPRCGSTS